MNTQKDWALTAIISVAVIGAVVSIAVGTLYQVLTDTLPEQTVYLERVIHDGEYEKHVEIVEYHYRGFM